MRETYRKLFHMTFGAIISLGVYFLGRSEGLIALGAMLTVGLLIIHWKITGYEDRIIDFFLDKMERHVSIPGIGALMFIIGAILVLSFSKSETTAVAILLIFAFGDGASTLVGRLGHIRIPYNRQKTLEGTIAFILAAMIGSFPLIGIMSIPYSIALSIVESLPIPIDDNLSIPSVGALLSHFI